MSSSKTAVSLSSIGGKILSVLGYLLEALFLICLIVYISERMLDASITFIILMALCSLLIIAGAKIKHRILRFHKYSTIISVHNITSLDLIALETSHSIDFIKKDLQSMINKGFFINAYIDYNTNTIIMSGEATTVMPIPPQPVNTEKTAISCRNCGAMNEITKGELANCAYCGSPLK